MKWEVPPTAGLPLRWADLRPGGGREDFGQQVAAFLDVDQVQIACSGTAALVIALTALRASSKRRTVVVPAYTCPLVPLAIAHCGLRVAVCDLSPDHFDMDRERLMALCDEDTLAVLPTHIAGRTPDLQSTMQCARAAGAWIVEDAAQAFSAAWPGAVRSGSADITFSSLAVGKGLTIYEGGVLYAQDERWRRELRTASARLVRSQGITEAMRMLQLIGYTLLYRPRALHFVYGAPLRRALERRDLEAAYGDVLPRRIALHRVGRWRRRVGGRALKRLARFQELAAVRALERIPRLRQIRDLKVLVSSGCRETGSPEAHVAAWPCLLVLMPTQCARDAAISRLSALGLGVARLFVHALEDYPNLRLIVPRANASRARDFASRALTISNSHWLTDEAFERVACELQAAIASGAAMLPANVASSRSLSA